MNQLLKAFLLGISAFLFGQEILIPMKVGDKFGISDLQKNIIVEPQYEFIDYIGKEKYTYTITNEKNLFGFSFIAYPNSDDFTTYDIILDGKVVKIDSNFKDYAVSGDLFLCIKKDDNWNELIELYSANGKRVNQKFYQWVELLKETSKEQLMLLVNEKNDKILAIYDKELKTFTNVVIRNIIDYILLNEGISGNQEDKGFKYYFNEQNDRFSTSIEYIEDRIPTGVDVPYPGDPARPKPISSEKDRSNLRDILSDENCNISSKFEYEKDQNNIKIGKYNYSTIECNKKVGLLGYYQDKVEISPQYDNIFKFTSSYTTLKLNQHWSIPFKLNDYDEVKDNLQFLFDGIPYPYGEDNYFESKLKNILTIYDENTLELKYYALHDGTIFYQP